MYKLHGQITIAKRMIDCCVCLYSLSMHARARVFELCSRAIHVDRKPEVFSVYSSSCQDIFGLRDNARDESLINIRLMNSLCSLGCNASSFLLVCVFTHVHVTLPWIPLSYRHPFLKYFAHNRTVLAYTYRKYLGQRSRNLIALNSCLFQRKLTNLCFRRI